MISRGDLGESAGRGKRRNLALPFMVGYTRDFALEPREFRDRSFSWRWRTARRMRWPTN
jgi:hypothetical protein